MVNLGDEVQDTITGFKGIVIADHNFLNGCRRISVQPKVDKDGKKQDHETFDEPDLKVLKAKKVKRGDISIGGPEKYTPSKRPGD